MSRAAVPVLVAFMLLTGVCNTLLTKYQDMQCVADCDTARPKMFEQPVIQTLQMFVGEAGCWLVLLFGILFRRARRYFSDRRDNAYRPLFTDDQATYGSTAGAEEEDDLHNDAMTSSQTIVDASNAPAKALTDAELSGIPRQPLTGVKILLLATPAICDILGTTLMNIGLLFVAASIYQMLRGTLILFVGLFSVLFLKRRLGGWKWASLFIVVLGVAVVGLAGALSARSHSGEEVDETTYAYMTSRVARALESQFSSMEVHTAAQTVMGLFLIAAAQIFAATQFVVEESIMERYSMEPIQVVAWEGTFGFLVTLAGMGILHAAIGQTPQGKGGYFDAREGFYQVFHHPAIGITSLLIMFSIGGFNFFGLSVTRTVSATARSTIDTSRTLGIWLVSLGLGWEKFGWSSWIQIAGFALLVYGTFLFNDIVQPPTIAFLRQRRRGPIALEDGE